jgi:hypothetical protein
MPETRFEGLDSLCSGFATFNNPLAYVRVYCFAINLLSAMPVCCIPPYLCMPQEQNRPGIRLQHAASLALTKCLAILFPASQAITSGLEHAGFCNKAKQVLQM